MQKLRKGDEVVVMIGKDKSRRGVILKVIRETDSVVVENINMVKRHSKGNPAQGTPGGIVEKEQALHISNVAIWNSVAEKPDRVGVKILEDGKKVRVFQSDGEVIDV